jgi:hypothetical protein
MMRKTTDKPATLTPQQRYLATPEGRAAQRRAEAAYRERKRASRLETMDIGITC